MAMGPYLSIITLNVNGLNAPTFKLQESQKKRTKRSHEKILEEIIDENFPKMGKEIITQVKETQRAPNRINPR